jgi:hypothetical protein
MSISRLHRWYQLATPEQREHGREWYPKATRQCQEIANATDYSLRVVCGVVAALSPNSRWEQNLDDAERLLYAVRDASSPADYEEFTVTTYHANKLKAWCIAELGDISYLRGPKVVAFYYNLLGDSGKVTLDSHAFNAFMGARVVGSKRKKITKREHAIAINAFERVAHHYGEKPSALQAIIWLVWKGRIDSGLVPGYSR